MAGRGAPLDPLTPGWIATYFRLGLDANFPVFGALLAHYSVVQNYYFRKLEEQGFKLLFNNIYFNFEEGRYAEIYNQHRVAFMARNMATTNLWLDINLETQLYRICGYGETSMEFTTPFAAINMFIQVVKYYGYAERHLGRVGCRSWETRVQGETRRGAVVSHNCVSCLPAGVYKAGGCGVISVARGSPSEY